MHEDGYGASDREQKLNDLNDLADYLMYWADEAREKPCQKQFNVADVLEEKAREIRAYEKEVRDGSRFYG